MTATRHIPQGTPGQRADNTIPVHCPECGRCILKVADGVTTNPGEKRLGTVLAQCRTCKRWPRIALYARAA